MLSLLQNFLSFVLFYGTYVDSMVLHVGVSAPFVSKQHAVGSLFGLNNIEIPDFFFGVDGSVFIHSYLQRCMTHVGLAVIVTAVSQVPTFGEPFLGTEPWEPIIAFLLITRRAASLVSDPPCSASSTLLPHGGPSTVPTITARQPYPFPQIASCPAAPQPRTMFGPP